MTALVIYEIAIVMLYLAVRALFPELFVSTQKAKAPSYTAKLTRRHASRPHFVRHYSYEDSSRSAGMAMAIR